MAFTLMVASGTWADTGPAESAWIQHVNGQDDEARHLLTGVSIDDARAVWLRGWLGYSGDSPLALAATLEAAGGEAVPAYTAALAVAEAGIDSLGILVCLERLATLAVEERRTEDAVAHLERTLILTDLLDQPVAALLAHLDQGRVLVRTRDVEGATLHLETARATAAELGIHRWHADAAMAFSIVHRLRMDLEASLALREEAYEAYTEADFLPGRARAQHYIGTIHAMRGELTKAMVRLRSAEDLARESGSLDVLGGCLGDQAGIHYLIGEFERAVDQYNEAASLVTDPRRVGWYENNIGSILSYQQRHEEALPHFATALASVRATGDRNTESTIMLAMGQTLSDLGRVDEALDILDQAIAHAREWDIPLDEAKAIEVKGHSLLDAGRVDEAAPLLVAAGEMAERLGYFDLQDSVHRGLATVARRQGRLHDAIAHLERAAATVQDVRRRSGGSASVQSGYFGQVGPAFTELVDVLDDLNEQEPGAGHDHRAWEVVQRGRARTLLDMLAEAEVDLRIRADASYRDRESELLTAMAGLDARRLAAPDSAVIFQRQAVQLETNLETLEAELRAADPRYAELRYPRPVSLTDIQSEVLQPGEALLEYQLGDDRSHAWIVGTDRFVMHRLAGRSEIEDAVRTLLPYLSDANLAGDAVAWFAAPARAAARLLIDPLRADLEGVDRLIIVADGLLHYLPFAALPVDDAPVTTFAELPWLISAFEVTTTPSASTLSSLRSLPDVIVGSPLLLLGDPSLPRLDDTSILARTAGAGGLSPAPAADAEFAGLLEIYGRSAHAFAEDRATAARLADRPPAGGGWRTIHLATHGLFNEQRPQYSGLVLAPDPDTGHDGFLSVDEIFALDLDCDQIVLSACSTALGELVDGEGMVGLTRAFLYAGAHSVVAALWDVSGDGAARFMTGYHRRLADTPTASRTTALCAEQRAMSGDDGRTTGGLPVAHPSFWAGFTATGDAR